MGIDTHAWNFLRYCAKRQGLGRTLTLGRQKLFLPRSTLAKIIPRSRHEELGPYCEKLLIDALAATTVDSLDNSSFEGATVIADLNQPLAGMGEFDTIIDGGCTEHIFDIGQVFRNIALLAAPGAQIVHVVPGNQFCGHGFWQMSPELFYSMYSRENGFAETEVFVANLHDESNWFAVDAPTGGKRIEIASATPLYLLVRTVKRSATAALAVQQSDYAFEWERNAKTSRPATMLDAVGRWLARVSAVAPRSQALGRRIRDAYRLRKIRIGRNAGLHRVRVQTILG